MEKPLRPYQATAREQIHEWFQEHDRALVVIATGGGKTILFSALAADVIQAGGRVLILTDQLDLVDQAIEKLREAAGIFADAEQGERSASPKAKVIVATVQTLGSRLERFPADHFALVVCDECDRAISPQWQEVLARFDQHARVLGVTATPDRADRKPILRYFRHKLLEVPLLELIENGYLVPITVVRPAIACDLSSAEKEGADDFDAEELSHAVEKIFVAVCHAILEHAPARKVLVFCPDVRSSKKFAAVASLEGLTCRHIDGESPNRQELKKGHQEWQPPEPGQKAPPHTFQVLVNPILLGRGYDDPSIDCVINLRPCRSKNLYQQIIGRGTRLFCPWGCGGPCPHPEAKRDLLVLDLLWQFKEMAPITVADLFTDAPAKRSEMVRLMGGQPRDLRELAQDAGDNLMRALVAAMMDAQQKKGGKPGEYFRATDFAANLQIPELASYVPETDAEAEPVSDRIKKRLSKAGIQPETVLCAGHAERVLAAIQARSEAGLAGMRSVFWLRSWGYQNPEQMSKAAAKRILARKFREMGKYR